MRLEFPAFRPVICITVVTDIAQQEANVGAMHDDADVTRYANRPRPLILGLIEAVKLQTRMRWVHLEAEAAVLTIWT
jgi:hypothetical protein